MKTPMQILLEKIENGDFLHPKVIGEFIKYNLLEKEKEVVVLAHINGQSEFDNGAYRQEVIDNAEEYYNETFNTKQK